MKTDTFNISPHGDCDIVYEHGQEWAICHTCGAEWSVHGAELEQISEGDGYCDERGD